MLYLWVVVVILLAIVEVMTVDIVTIWYVISGLITIGVSFFVNNFYIQLGIFVMVGTLLLITTRPILKKIVAEKNIRTNLDRVIGMKGIVTEDIKNNRIGEVKVDGKRWSAISDTEILKDKNVKVLEIIGVKLKVEEVEE